MRGQLRTSQRGKSKEESNQIVWVFLSLCLCVSVSTCLYVSVAVCLYVECLNVGIGQRIGAGYLARSASVCSRAW